MAKARVISEFDKDGKAKVHVEGAVGPICTELTKKLEEALGTVTERELTPEHNMTQDQSDVEEQTN